MHALHFAQTRFHHVLMHLHSLRQGLHVVLVHAATLVIIRRRVITHVMSRMFTAPECGRECIPRGLLRGGDVQLGLQERESSIVVVSRTNDVAEAFAASGPHSLSHHHARPMHPRMHHAFMWLRNRWQDQDSCERCGDEQSHVWNLFRLQLLSWHETPWCGLTRINATGDQQHHNGMNGPWEAHMRKLSDLVFNQRPITMRPTETVVTAC